MSFLDDRGLEIILFGGKGGVGKTTLATATALHLAQNVPEDAFLLVSTDPAHSLADSFADSKLPPNLKVLELDAKECLARFKQEHRDKFREIVLRGTFLDNNDINQFLELSLPGLDELMAFFEISAWIQARRFRCILVDTAPTGHTLRLLAIPQLLRRWLEALDSLLAKHRFMASLYRGSYRHDDIDDFLEKMAGSVEEVESLLRDPKRCCFVIVMTPQSLVISETVKLVRQLERLCIPVRGILINQLYPTGNCPLCERIATKQKDALQTIFHQLSTHALWGAPLYGNEVRGLQSLEEFWSGIDNLTGAGVDSLEPGMQRPIHQLRSLILEPIVQEPADLPSSEANFLLFAGKGGVGKTTLACATAIRLTRDFGNAKVLLFSTDPAHSLSDCLGVVVGPTPTRILHRLSAMEIDAQAEFDALKRQYAEDLQRFLENLSADLDLKFDREAMERIMDLSPPGLDEVMALTGVMESSVQETYNIFVLDCAPTGHLVRLLETPDIVEQWLEVVFGIFLKYKRIFNLPGVIERLVTISKHLKQLKALLTDSKKATLYVVTILTEMAFEETTDLMAACKRIGINAPVVFHNLATPASECSLCSSLHEREFHVLQKFLKTFPEKQHTVVYRFEEPTGLKRLGELGWHLYRMRSPSPVIEEG